MIGLVSLSGVRNHRKQWSCAAKTRPPPPLQRCTFLPSTNPTCVHAVSSGVMRTYCCGDECYSLIGFKILPYLLSRQIFFARRKLRLQPVDNFGLKPSFSERALTSASTKIMIAEMREAGWASAMECSWNTKYVCPSAPSVSLWRTCVAYANAFHSFAEDSTGPKP